MNFLVGEKVKNTMRDRTGVITALDGDVALVNYGDGPERTSLKYLALAVAKRAPFQHVLATDPAALLEFAAHYKTNGGRIEICCGPQDLEKEADRLSGNSSLSPSEAFDYIRVATEKSQSAKHDIIMDKSFPEALAARMSVLLWASGKTGRGFRCKRNEVQINSRALAEYLMRVHNVLPVREVAYA